MRRPQRTLLAFCTLALLGSAYAAPARAIESCGDLNDDGAVTSSDALGLLRAAVGELRCHVYVCDLNGDQSFTATDALAALGAAVGLFTPADCPDEPTPGDQSNDRVTIVNTPAVLSGRVQLTYEEVPIAASGVGALRAGVGGPNGLQLTLVASVSPPQVDGYVLQATSVQRAQSANHFVVTYNVHGEPRLGGIEYFDLQNEDEPELTSQALFSDTDVSAAMTSNFAAYLAEATNDPGFTWPAALERIAYKKGRFVLEDSLRVPLTSYAATSVFVAGGDVYVTTGDAGAVSLHDSTTLASSLSVELDDLRWIDVQQGVIIAAQGTPGRLSLLDAGTFEVLAIWPFSGADIPESKSTVVVHGGKAFVAAGSAGVQVVSLATGALLGSLPTPKVPGLDSSVVVANAVAAHGNLVFVSNGEAGVYVARLSSDPASSGSEDPVQFELLGQLQFGALESVNHVEYQGRYLIVASGLGGLKVVRVDN